MSLHKLTAGDGYTYLTRQVAAQDATHRGYDGLGDYYAQRGESPGVWLGRGADGLPEFPADPQVTEAQMVALFGEGRHPDAERIETELVAAGHGVPAVLAATRLGSPYKVFTSVPEFRRQLAARFEAANAEAGLPRDWPVPEADRARIRTELGREMFTAEIGRAPADARELSGFLARASRQQPTAVAGYDLTFTPVKSVSALWAVAPRQVAQAVEDCHAQVVTETLGWLEEHAAYSRLGRNGVRQVQVRGLIAAAFTHRDSRAGDPNLHTHVAVSNKVQVAAGPQAGQWVALDGRPVHKLAVAASERYNTRLEALLRERLGVRFADRPAAEPGKRPVRELVGVDEQLLRAWSARRAAIEVRRAELAGQFQREHGRPPGPIEAVKLAQRATLETRQAKHEPRTHAEQRAAWREQAVAVLGGAQALTAMLSAVRQPAGTPAAAVPTVTAGWVADTAKKVLATVQSARATWQEAHVRAEAERRARAADLPPGQVEQAVERVVAAALSPACSLPLGVAEPVSEPALLRRTDGSSMYATAGMQLNTSPQVVAAERALLTVAQRTDGRTASAATVDLAILESAANGVALNPGQAALVRALAGSGSRLQLALAPAGTGKTTAMAVLARAWTGDGGTVIGLAPSAAAAAVLAGELHAPTDTLAKLIWSLDTLQQNPGAVPDWVQQIGPRTLVVLDEAGMAGTAELARAVEFVVARGGSVRLIGDDCQLAAVGAGGVLRDLAETAGAVTLSQVVRFTDPAEGAASLALRAGENAAIGFYIDNSRVHVGDAAGTTDAAYAAWSAHRAAGLDALMLAPTRDVAAALNTRARADRLTAADTAAAADAAATGTSNTPAADPGAGRTGGLDDRPEVQLVDGSRASAGDTVITRRNNRRLALSATDWVKNGDRWTVEQVLPGGALQVQHLGTRRRLHLPADYTAEHVALGYASTVHAAQGSTADVCHTVATGAETRQLLYVAMTRGRTANHLYLATAGDGDEHTVLTPDALRPPTAVDLLERILRRDGAQRSASTAQRALADPAGRLAAAADRYHDSLALAATQHLGEQRLANLDEAAEQVLPGLTGCPAYPALRAHLALLACDTTDPAPALTAALQHGELRGAADPAAVLQWRLDPTQRQRGEPGATDQPGTSDGATGPLPWLPAIPAELAADPTWAGYLQARDAHTRDLAGRVAEQARGWTPTSAPAWAAPLVGAEGGLLARLAVWRAARDVDVADLRPTGPPRLPAADARAQQALDAAVRRALGDPAAHANRWRTVATSIEPRLTDDPFWPQLADRLAAADRAGIDIAALARTAGQTGPLPDELPAAALWWRLSRQLAPAALDAHNSDTTSTASTLRPAWTPALVGLAGEPAARRVLADPAWPALVAAVTDATRAGWTPEQVLTTACELLETTSTTTTSGSTNSSSADDPGRDQADPASGGPAVRPAELATALVWRIAMLSDPEPWHPDDQTHPGGVPPDPLLADQQPPDDLHAADPGWHDPDPDAVAVAVAAPITTGPAHGPAADEADWLAGLVEPQADQEPPHPDEEPADQHSVDRQAVAQAAVDQHPVHGAARAAALERAERTTPTGDADGAVSWALEQPDPTLPEDQTRLWQPAEPAVPPERLRELNDQAGEFFCAGYPGSWAAGHLQERLGNDLTEDGRFSPGYAPAGWTALVDHLRARGASDPELLAAGLASTARTGRLIDRFRDRLILPIQTDGPDGPQTVGFIGRRNPDTPDAGPKYLNTGETALFSKGAQLYGLAENAEALAAGARPVLVEGPLDAIAVTLAAQGSAVGVAPLGTAFTDRQADQLRPYLGPGKPGVVVATDADSAGHKAADRAYWQLTCRGGNPTHLVLPDGQDPAGLLTEHGPQALRDALAGPPTLARTMIDARVALFADRMHDVVGPLLAVRAAADAIGALPPEHWLEHIDYLNTLVKISPGESHLAVLDAGHAWGQDPDGLARKQLTARPVPPTPRTAAAAAAPPMRQRPPADPAPAGAATATPATSSPTRLKAPGPADANGARGNNGDDLVEQWAADVWVDVGRSIDPRLVAGADWSGLAAALNRASRAGYDVQQHLPRLAAHRPLPDDKPARALHYRLVQACSAAITPLPARVQHAEDSARSQAARDRLDTEARRRDSQQRATAAEPPRQPPDQAAARPRLAAEPRRLDDQRVTASPAPGEAGPAAARPAAAPVPGGPAAPQGPRPPRTPPDRTR